MDIVLEDLYKDIVAIILEADGKFKDTVYDLAKKALLKKHSEDEANKIMTSAEMDDMLFDLDEMMRKKAKENGYTMRAVPCKEEGGNWGLPYNIECYFSKRTS